SGQVPYLTNIYEAAGPRVTQQYLGGTGTSGVPSGGRYCFLYRNNVLMHSWFTEINRTLVIDPNGNTSLSIFDVEGDERLRYRCRGRLNPNPPPPQVPPPSWPIVVNPSNPDPNSDRLSPAAYPKLR